MWVNHANLASATVNRGGGDTHTWNEIKTSYHDTPLVPASALAAEQAKVRELVEVLDLLVKYTESCEGLLNAKPAGQVTVANAAITKYGEQK